MDVLFWLTGQNTISKMVSASEALRKWDKLAPLVLDILNDVFSHVTTLMSSSCFLKRPQKLTKSSKSIWHYVVIARKSALEKTQLSDFWSPIICFDRTIIGDQNIWYLCHFKADLRAIRIQNL